MTSKRLSSVALALAGAATTAIVLVSVAGAQNPETIWPGVIQGCVKTSDGTTRIVNSPPTTLKTNVCPSGFLQVNWNGAGPKGDPGAPGAPGTPGAKGDQGDPGTPGTNGTNGTDGKDGVDGANGLSAYELWSADAHTGSLSDFFVSLKGDRGVPGVDGAPGKDGVDGAPGKDGLDGAPGAPGTDGQSAYQLWVADGHPDASLDDFFTSLKGKDGADGAPGRDGVDGAPGRDGVDGAPGRDGVDGAPGKDGVDGAPGKDGVDGATGTFGSVIVRTGTAPAGGNTASALCQTGETAVGGGYAETDNKVVSQSMPAMTGTTPTGWTVKLAANLGAGKTLTAYVLCATH